MNEQVPWTDDDTPTDTKTIRNIHTYAGGVLNGAHIMEKLHPGLSSKVVVVLKKSFGSWGAGCSLSSGGRPYRMARYSDAQKDVVQVAHCELDVSTSSYLPLTAGLLVTWR